MFFLVTQEFPVCRDTQESRTPGHQGIYSLRILHHFGFGVFLEPLVVTQESPVCMDAQEFRTPAYTGMNYSISQGFCSIFDFVYFSNPWVPSSLQSVASPRNTRT